MLVWVTGLDGVRRYGTFQTEVDAEAFIAKAQTKLVRDGRPIEDVIEVYVEEPDEVAAVEPDDTSSPTAGDRERQGPDGD